MAGCQNEEFADYKYGISIGRRLDDIIIEKAKLTPTQAYLKHYDMTNEILTQTLKKIENELQKNNLTCIYIPPIPENLGGREQLEFNKRLQYKLSHKMVATRAGLGWIGKTSLFISSRFGPRVRLGSILSQTPLHVNAEPMDSSRCEDCNLCVEACPVKAPSGKVWNSSMERSDFLDVYKCRKHIFNNYYKKNLMLCANCLAACPIGAHNEKYQYTSGGSNEKDT